MKRVRLCALALALACGACSASPTEEADDGQENDLRSLQEGVDVNEVLIDAVPAERPPAGMPDVRSWTVRYVELRDPAHPENPDPADPFNGFFLIANDKDGAPLFFETMALADDGVAHFFFSFETATAPDGTTSYVELPLLAAPDDAEGAARAAANAAWLTSERGRLAEAIHARYGADDTPTGTSTITPLALGSKLRWLKCVADLAVYGLGFVSSNPMVFFLAQAAVDGTFALVDAFADKTKSSDDLAGAVTWTATAGVTRGVGKAVTKAVAKGLVSEGTAGALKKVGGPAYLVGMVGAVGYQFYEHGAKGGLQAALKLIIPKSCQEAYANMSKVPPSNVPAP